MTDISDTVKKDEPLVELETDKAAQELVSPEDGVLEEILVAEGENAEVGKLIAKLGSGSGAEKTEPAAKAEAPKAASGGSALNIDVPNVGESVSEVTIASWMKQPGEAVAQLQQLRRNQHLHLQVLTIRKSCLRRRRSSAKMVWMRL